MNLFMFLVLMYDLKVKVRNDARVMPSSDHRVYMSCRPRMYNILILVRTNRWLVKAEPLT